MQAFKLCLPHIRTIWIIEENNERPNLCTIHVCLSYHCKVLQINYTTENCGWLIPGSVVRTYNPPCVENGGGLRGGGLP